MTALTPVLERRFALGVGLTNACNLSCEHCYRAVGTDQLSVDQVLRAVEAFSARAVNFGTGESALHPDFAALVRELRARGIAATVTTNGYSAKALPDDVLTMLRDVEFSIDYPSECAHDEARGSGNWALIEEQMSRCYALGVDTTIITVMMSTNHRALPALARLAYERGALLRINVYQAVRTNAFSLSFDQFWRGWLDLLEVADLVTCGEPILRAMLGIPHVSGSGCGVGTVRLTPKAAVVPCVYHVADALPLDQALHLGARVVEHDSFRRLRTVPSACKPCPHVTSCGGGCASRRALRGRLDLPDEYCPIARGRGWSLGPRAAVLEASRDMPKAASACTTIVRLRQPAPSLPNGHA